MKLIKSFGEYPGDIQKIIKRRIAKKLLGLTAMLALIIVFGFEGGFEYFAIPERRLKTAAVFLMFTVIAVCVSGIHKELLDRSFGGRVLSVTVKTTIKPPSGGGGRGSGRVKWINTVYAGILCDNGRVVKKAVLQYYSGAKWFVKIHEGDTVVHYKWCPHTRIDRADGSMTTCVMCGAMNKTAEEHCVDCGATLMHTLK